MPPITTYLLGANTLGYVIAALFFLRAWRRTGDILFPFFSGAFVLLALNEIGSALQLYPGSERSLVFLLRIAGFSLIVVGIVSKNLGFGTNRSA